MISAACPAVVRLIQVRFPALIDSLIPVDSPMACSGKLAKEAKSRSLESVKVRSGLSSSSVPCQGHMGQRSE